MRPFTRWIGIGAALGIVGALVPFMGSRSPLEQPTGPLGKVEHALFTKPAAPDFTGLDLARMDIRPERVVVPMAEGRVAELSLDPLLQRAVQSLMRRFRLPEAGTVMMDVRTGKLLVYASFVREGTPYDVNARAVAPAASVFKIVTGAALVERANLNADTKQCYRGGRSRISAEELREDADKDKWCATLGEAMGRSLNVVFGRLAQKHLMPEDIARMGGAFGFGNSVPFVLPNQAPSIEVPEEPLEFARTSAGFWHTTLSPLAAVGIAQTIASDGITLQPRLVSKLIDKGQVSWEDDGKPKVLRHAIQAPTAREVGKMMTHTVTDGSARAAFHDGKGRSFLPGVGVAGKTGTLTKADTDQTFTWFVGYAPADRPEVAVATLVVNTPTWHIKAPELARDALRAYFAKAGRPGVSAPN
ncbi:MAG TPA: penicillin-binding transpeptidase domain-containing protein [Polyangiaceae bacterium]|nr:penicillin-binding transpeptidase domain-containing protein [Polyangiaceae bacterium]